MKSESRAPLLNVEKLGLTEYGAAHATQQDFLQRRIDGQIGNHLLLTEHLPVITVGRGASRAGLEATGLPIVEVERGGEATYHGPGQVVAYPIIELGEDRRDLHQYLRDLEEVVIGVLAEFEVEGRREPGLTGVWVGSRKVASVGVAVRRWVTWHGLALNVRTELEAFQSFRPCGLDPALMTRMADLAELPPGNTLLEVLLVKHFCAVFGFELPPPPPLAQPPAGPFPDLPIFPG